MGAGTGRLWLRDAAMRRIPLSVQSLIGLSAGLAVGLLSHGTDNSILLELVAAAKMVATIWTRLLQSTIVPLVIGLVTARIMNIRTGQIGRLGTAAVFSTIIVATVVMLLGGAASRVALTMLPDSGSVAAILHERAAELSTLRPAAPPPPENWVEMFIPVNVVRAAGDGRTLQVLFFVMLFAFAARTLPLEQRVVIQRFCEALGAATLVIIRWLMYFVPIGVAALVIPLTAQLGSGIVSALARVTGLVLLITVGLILSLYVVVALVGRISPWVFARAVAPGQAVALTTRSSLAAFPAVMKGAHDHLPLPHDTIDFLLPIVSLNLTVSRAVSMVEFVLIGELAGISVGYSLMLAFLVAKLGVKAGGVGLPSTGKSSFAIMVALGMPIEGALLVTAIAPIIDPFSTALNVTGDMAITAIAGRLGLSWSGDPAPVSSAAEPRPVVVS